MATKVWMPTGTRGCPMSQTIFMTTGSGELRVYRFTRNQGIMVEDEHVDAIVARLVPDMHGNPHQIFTTAPPPTDLSDADKLRMHVEAQDQKINQLTELVQGMTGGDIDVNVALGIPEGDNPVDVLSGMLGD